MFQLKQRPYIFVVICIIQFVTLPGILMGQQDFVRTIMVDGLMRDYRLHLPQSYDTSKPIPLVFCLHGYSSNALQMELYSGMDKTSDQNGFAVCYPNAINTKWNAGYFFGNDADDVGFISNLVEILSSEFHFDKNRIYACGMSNGGFMSYLLACELSDKIAAIASVTGGMSALDIANCKPGKSVPVLEIHGTADPIVDYNGSALLSVAIPKLMEFWRVNNGCSSNPIIESIPNTVQDNTTTEKWTYSHCNDSKRVEHYKVINGGHTWPGSSIIIGVTSQDFNASQVIWDFFKDYSLVETSHTEQISSTGIHIFPNPATGFINIEVNDKTNIQITDVYGNIVFAKKDVNSNFVLDVNLWKVGMYILIADNNHQNSRSKILIQ